MVRVALAGGGDPVSSTSRLFQEAHTHLGVETQRQWSDRAMARTTPLLLGLFSWMTLAPHVLGDRRLATTRSMASYTKADPTFVNAIALVRRHLWVAAETCTPSTSLV